MTNCINCDANCFSPTDIGCISWSGGAIASLNIKDGDSLKSVLAKLIQSHIDLTDKVSKCKLCDNVDYVNNDEQYTISLAGLAKTSTSCSASITSTNFTYNIVGNSTSIGLQYSFQDIIDNLPANFSVAKKSLKIWGSDTNTALYSTTSNNSGVYNNIEPSRFPLKLDFSLQVNTPCGLISIDKVVIVSNITNGNYSAIGVVSDYGLSDYGTATQESFNEIIRDKLITIERDVNSIKNLNVESSGSVLLPSKQLDVVIQTLINKI